MISPDSGDEGDHSARRGHLDEFRRRRRYSIPMNHQPIDKATSVITRMLYLDVTREDFTNVRETSFHLLPLEGCGLVLEPVGSKRYIGLRA